MPIYDYKCDQCDVVTEKIQPSSVDMIWCPSCINDEPIVNDTLGVGIAYRQLSVPAGFRFPDMVQLNRKRQRITNEPVWRDKVTGKATSVHP